MIKNATSTKWGAYHVLSRLRYPPHRESEQEKWCIDSRVFTARVRAERDGGREMNPARVYRSGNGVEGGNIGLGKYRTRASARTHCSSAPHSDAHGAVLSGALL